ncbi:hypothetical protein pb186bvf_001732 [Paramecium bursaria]
MSLILSSNKEMYIPTADSTIGKCKTILSYQILILQKINKFQFNQLEYNQLKNKIQIRIFFKNQI